MATIFFKCKIFSKNIIPQSETQFMLQLNITAAAEQYGFKIFSKLLQVIFLL